MDAIKKKMQVMKVEKDNAMDDADLAELKARASKQHSKKAEEELEELVGQSQKLEMELDMAQEELALVTKKLKEKDEQLNSADLELSSLNRRVQAIEGDIEDCEEKLKLASVKLDKATTSGDDSDRLRKVMESKATSDEERIRSLGEELKISQHKAAESDEKYEEIQKLLIKTESDLETAEEQCDVWEIKIVDLEEELAVVANNLRSLEVAKEEANQREMSNKSAVKKLSSKLKQAEARAEFAEKSVQKLQAEVRLLTMLWLDRLFTRWTGWKTSCV